LREYLTHSEKTINSTTKNCKSIWIVCSCKACASECPSNVDIAAMKSGFLPISKTNGFHGAIKCLLLMPNWMDWKYHSKITNFMVNLPLVKKNGIALKYRFWLQF
jgi:hypothetical protein